MRVLSLVKDSNILYNHTSFLSKSKTRSKSLQRLKAAVVLAGVSVLMILAMFLLLTPSRQVSGNYPLYPDLAFTPGDTLPVSEKEVCKVGYTDEVRKVPSPIRKAVFLEYEIPYPPVEGEYELDHFIPLELGGSNDIKNLWPEPAEPRPGFHQKDVVENYLHRQVCSGKMSLHKAQEAIRTNWLTVYKEYTEHH